MVVFAGPNGSGKTTLKKALYLEDPSLAKLPFLNADELAKSEGLSSYDAAERIREQARQYTDNQESFSWETVMSHTSKIDAMAYAREKGFRVHLFFLGTSNPDLNVANVRRRVEEGGHDVPEEKTRDRWDRVMHDLLFQALKAANTAVIFESTQGDFFEVARMAKETIQYSTTVPPDWFSAQVVSDATY